MELLPCPFCGGEALPTAHLTYNWFAPVCNQCNARGPSVKIERDSTPQEMRELINQADENWNRRSSPASVPEGFTLSAPTLLPDGSGFGIMSFPLPKDHWLYKECEYAEGAVEPNDLPVPILTHSLRQQVIAAIRYAVRSATNCGKEDDFDPDALVQNAVYALCGPYGKAAPTPPVSEDRKDAELLDYIQNHGATIQIVPMANRTFGFEVGGLHKSRKLSVREAIDAAMQEDKP